MDTGGGAPRAASLVRRILFLNFFSFSSVSLQEEYSSLISFLLPRPRLATTYNLIEFFSFLSICLKSAVCEGSCQFSVFFESYMESILFRHLFFLVSLIFILFLWTFYFNLIEFLPFSFPDEKKTSPLCIESTRLFSGVYFHFLPPIKF